MAIRTVSPEATWTFLTNHAHVLLCIARDPEVRLRELADLVGITERAAHRIVVDLEASGYLSRERNGRRTHYEVHDERRLRHPIERHRTVASLIALLRAERRKAH
jgi:DNA-binding MarR family transcriptional regulator